MDLEQQLAAFGHLIDQGLADPSTLAEYIAFVDKRIRKNENRELGNTYGVLLPMVGNPSPEVDALVRRRLPDANRMALVALLDRIEAHLQGAEETYFRSLPDDGAPS